MLLTSQWNISLTHKNPLTTLKLSQVILLKFMFKSSQTFHSAMINFQWHTQTRNFSSQNPYAHDIFSQLIHYSYEFYIKLKSLQILDIFSRKNIFTAMCIMFDMQMLIFHFKLINSTSAFILLHLKCRNHFIT